MIICVARESAFQRFLRQMSKSLFPGSERLLSDAARNTKYASVGQAGNAYNIINIFAAQCF